MARALELYDDGTIYLLLMVDVAAQKTFWNVFHWQPAETRSAQVGSVEARKMLEDEVREMTDAVRQAVELLVDHLPDQTAAD
jgi:hypothetical protein